MSPDKPIEDKPAATGAEDVDYATDVQRDLHRSLCMWIDAGKPSAGTTDKPTEDEPIFDSTPGIDSVIVRMLESSHDVKDVSLLTLLYLKGLFNSRERKWRVERAALHAELATAKAEIQSLRIRIDSFFCCPNCHVCEHAEEAISAIAKCHETEAK